MGFSSKNRVRALFPLGDRSRSTHKWARNGYAGLHELGAQLVLTSPDTKETTPAGKGHAYRLPCCSVCLQMLRGKRGFTAVSGASKWKGDCPVQRQVVQPDDR